VRTTDTIAAFRKARAGFASIGLIPTMGYLHEGHLSLVRRAKAECGAAAVSIFVNPTQFNRPNDLAAYPRDLDGDLAMLAEAGADLVFTPAVETIYPPGFDAHVLIGGVSEGLEGDARPGHFDGVATVVLKLLNIAQPNRAYFGQKDAQQAAVIKKMVRDLDVPCEIDIAPTVREADGLAMSSRNVRLTPLDRAAAPVLHRALQAGAALIAGGEGDAQTVRATVRAMIAAEPLARIDYVSAADAATLKELDRIDGPALLSLAVFFGDVRLIDNLEAEPPCP
jgi:pantoate--beta-alanine ligase